MYLGLAIGLGVALLMVAVVAFRLTRLTERMADRLMSRDYADYASGRVLMGERPEQPEQKPDPLIARVGHEDVDDTPLETLAARAEAGFQAFVGPPAPL